MHEAWPGIGRSCRRDGLSRRRHSIWATALPPTLPSRGLPDRCDMLSKRHGHSHVKTFFAALSTPYAYPQRHAVGHGGLWCLTIIAERRLTHIVAAADCVLLATRTGLHAALLDMQSQASPGYTPRSPALCRVALTHRLPTPAETGSGGRGCAHGLVRALWDDSVSAFLSRSSCMAGVRQLVEMFALLAGFQLRLAGCPSTQIVHALLRRKGPRACERTRTLALLSGCKTVSVSTWSCFASLPSSRLGSSESLRSVL